VILIGGAVNVILLLFNYGLDTHVAVHVEPK
jgi:hypothetical protein